MQKDSEQKKEVKEISTSLSVLVKCATFVLSLSLKENSMFSLVDMPSIVIVSLTSSVMTFTSPRILKLRRWKTRLEANSMRSTIWELLTSSYARSRMKTTPRETILRTRASCQEFSTHYRSELAVLVVKTNRNQWARCKRRCLLRKRKR